MSPLHWVRTSPVLPLLIGASAVGASVAFGQESPGTVDSTLARGVASARTSLARGLRAASTRGRPISAKYEMEDGKLQLSVYTARGTAFSEIVVDHRTGRVSKSDTIDKGDDLSAAQAQSQAMAAAKRTLADAVVRALRQHRGYRAVSISPTRSDGRVTATVILVKGRTFKTVSEPLS